ncbi:MAG: hypothetical protein JZU65_19105, partial [Chlorobium sp.]|nr:hypothetical protein [Chlorobium sp.]
MSKDLTNSALDRQNILKNAYALREIEQVTWMECSAIRELHTWSRTTRNPLGLHPATCPRPCHFDRREKSL